MIYIMYCAFESFDHLNIYILAVLLHIYDTHRLP